MNKLFVVGDLHGGVEGELSFLDKPSSLWVPLNKKPFDISKDIKLQPRQSMIIEF